LAVLLAMSPLVLVLAVVAKVLRTRHTPELGTIGEEHPEDELTN
jgi:hypothetical protein